VNLQVEADVSEKQLSPTSTPEDGASMFPRNVGIDLQIHTVPKPKSSATT
jgi:hypothetical protein